MSFRNFFITINNYSEEEYNALYEMPCRYLVIGKEVGKKCGQPHIHACLVFENARSWKKMKSLFPRARIEKMKGSPEEARTYCVKDGDYVEKGDCPKQGKRNDIVFVMDMVQEGLNMRQMLPEVSNFQTIRIAETVMKYYEVPRDYKPIVKWFWGATGTGKTEMAFKMFKDEDYYVCMDTGQWWEGYDGQENIIIDELREDFMKYPQLLKLLDRYEYRIQVKGSSRQFKGRNIIITSHFHPYDLFQYVSEDLGQLYRRLEGIYEFRYNQTPIKQVFDFETKTLKQELG